jgi:nicotinamide riboside kinase
LKCLNPVDVLLMTKPLKIVLTGVENSGKSTLSTVLAKSLKWPLIPELCREDEDVIEGADDQTTLEKLHLLQEKTVNAVLSDGNTRGVICDTGGLVLEIWSEYKYKTAIKNVQQSQHDVDLYILCKTLPVWEEDPMRFLPEYSDRVNQEKIFVKKLKDRNLPYFYLEVASVEDRLKKVITELHGRFDI